MTVEYQSTLACPRASRAVLRPAIARLLGLSLTGEGDEVRLAHSVVPWAARQVVDSGVSIPVSLPILACLRSRWGLRRRGSARWCARGIDDFSLTRDLFQHVRQAIACQYDAAFGN